MGWKLKTSDELPHWRQVVRKALSFPFTALIVFYRVVIGPYVPKNVKHKIQD